jgi:hypothetical protein
MSRVELGQERQAGCEQELPKRMMRLCMEDFQMNCHAFK